jgi:hypothetical protein
VREARAGETARGEVLSQVVVRLAGTKHNPDPAHLIRRHVSIRAVEIRWPREPECYWPAALDRMFQPREASSRVRLVQPHAVLQRAVGEPPRAVRIEIVYYLLDARVGREEP